MKETCRYCFAENCDFRDTDVSDLDTPDDKTRNCGKRQCSQCPTPKQRLHETGAFQNLLPAPSYEKGLQCQSSGHWGSTTTHYGRCPGCGREFVVGLEINSPDFASFSQPNG